MVKSMRWVCMGLLVFGLVGCNSSKSKKRQIRRTGGAEKGRVQQPFQGSATTQTTGEGNPLLSATQTLTTAKQLQGQQTALATQNPLKKGTLVDIKADTDSVSVENSPLFQPVVKIESNSTTDNSLTYAKWTSLDPNQVCLGDNQLSGCNTLIIKDDDGEIELGPQPKTRALLLKTGPITEADKEMMFQLPVESLIRTKSVETLVVFRNLPKYVSNYQTLKNGLAELDYTGVSAKIYPVDIQQSFFDFPDLAQTLFRSLEKAELDLDAHRIIFNITDTENGCIQYTSGQEAIIECRDGRNPQVFANHLKENGLLSTTHIYDIVLSSETKLENVTALIDQLTRVEAETKVLYRSFYLPHREDQIKLDSLSVKIDGETLSAGIDFVIIKSESKEFDKLQINNIEKLKAAQMHLELSYDLK